MRPSELLKLKRDEILALAAKAGAMNVRVFGSAARGDDREESDLDLLVDWSSTASLSMLAAWWPIFRNCLASGST